MSFPCLAVDLVVRLIGYYFMVGISKMDQQELMTEIILNPHPLLLQLPYSHLKKH